jgi:hypothetical protein
MAVEIKTPALWDQSFCKQRRTTTAESLSIRASSAKHMRLRQQSFLSARLVRSFR